MYETIISLITSKGVVKDDNLLYYNENDGHGDEKISMMDTIRKSTKRLASRISNDRGNYTILP